MKKTFVLSAIALALLSGCGPKPEQQATTTDAPAAVATAPALQYAPTKQGEVVDTYFGTQVADPYRWLEDDRSAETAEWVKAQNNVTFDYLAHIPARKP